MPVDSGKNITSRKAWNSCVRVEKGRDVEGLVAATLDLENAIASVCDVVVVDIEIELDDSVGPKVIADDDEGADRMIDIEDARDICGEVGACRYDLRGNVRRVWIFRLLLGAIATGNTGNSVPSG